jgi:hypothetical protein
MKRFDNLVDKNIPNYPSWRGLYRNLWDKLYRSAKIAIAIGNNLHW